DNELTRYRYDVVLHVGQAAASLETERLAWISEQETPAQVAERLRAPHPARLLLSGIPSRRLSSDLAAVSLISASAESVSAGELRRRVQQSGLHGEDPDDFWSLGEEHGYSVRVGWSSGCSRGEFEAEWTAAEVAGGNTVSAASTGASPVDE